MPGLTFVISQNRTICLKENRVRWDCGEKGKRWLVREQSRKQGAWRDGQRLRRVGGSLGERRRQGTRWVPRPSRRCQSQGERQRAPGTVGDGEGAVRIEKRCPLPNPLPTSSICLDKSSSRTLLSSSQKQPPSNNAANPWGVPSRASSFSQTPGPQRGFFFFSFYKLKLYLPTPAGGFVIFCVRITLGERNPSGQSL